MHASHILDVYEDCNSKEEDERDAEDAINALGNTAFQYDRRQLSINGLGHRVNAIDTVMDPSLCQGALGEIMADEVIVLLGQLVPIGEADQALCFNRCVKSKVCDWYWKRKDVTQGDWVEMDVCMAVRVPPAMSSGLSASIAEVAAMSESAFRKRFSSSYESSPFVIFTRPFLTGMRDEGSTAEDEDPAAGDEGLAARVEGPGMDDESYCLDDESHGMDDEGRGLDDEIHSGYGSAPESERPERVSASRQPTLTTWTDPEDGMVYFDVLTYPPPVQTPPSPKWTSGLLPISPSPSVVPSPVSSPMMSLIVPSPIATPATAETELGAQVKMQGGLIRDHAVRLEELSPALFKRYDRDIGELFTRSRRLGMKFSPRGQTDAQRAALWHAISDVQGENWDLQLQLAEERRA
ncbi:hypothetical protein Tco_1175962 [Tanacetum coccineum]